MVFNYWEKILNTPVTKTNGMYNAIICKEIRHISYLFYIAKDCVNKSTAVSANFKEIWKFTTALFTRSIIALIDGSKLKPRNYL